LDFLSQSQNHLLFPIQGSREMKVTVMTRLLAKRDMYIDSAHK
jgi:hypothetical protein